MNTKLYTFVTMLNQLVDTARALYLLVDSGCKYAYSIRKSPADSSATDVYRIVFTTLNLIAFS